MRSGGAKGAETWVSDGALWRSRRCTLTLWRCREPERRCDAVLTLRRCVDAATLRRWSGAATLLALRCCDTATRGRRCDAVGAATLRRCDAVGAVGAATLLALRRGTLRRCWRCDVSFCKSAHGVASQLDTLDVYSTWCNALHQGTQGLNDVSLLSCHLGMFILHVVIASFWMRNAWESGFLKAAEITGLSNKETPSWIFYQ